MSKKQTPTVSIDKIQVSKTVDRNFNWEELTGIMQECSTGIVNLHKQIVLLTKQNKNIVLKSPSLKAELEGAEKQCIELMDRNTTILSMHSVKKENAYYPFVGIVPEVDFEKFIDQAIAYNNLVTTMQQLQTILMPHLISSIYAASDETNEPVFEGLDKINEILKESNNGND